MKTIEKVEKKTNRGGKRPNSGRKKGTRNKKTAAILDGVVQTGITPLDFLLNVMRDRACPPDADVIEKTAFHALRFEAAKAAAPYVHPKLASVEHAGKDGGAIKHSLDIEFVK